MPEIKTPPREAKDENGHTLFTFGPEHTLADIARWVSQNESERQEMLRLLREEAPEDKT